ncbi:MAG: ATP-binding cassette domain-containing protein [Candidatus Cloacimonetes bacterium]|nr:ATP-binding cassette domain-containing protein [Candidatus Cloacimonadota bacterium]
MIKITKIHKKFNAGSINEVYALRNISLDIKDGEWTTIIGTNGSGKSTLLNAIAGSFLPDSGRIILDGEDITNYRDYQRAKHISRVFQNPFMGTAPDMTIAENLYLAEMRGRSRLPKIGFTSSRISHYKNLIQELEMQLENRLDNIIGTLSGGQRQAITLLMAVIIKPKVLLLDEHTAALDPKTAAQIVKLTRKFIERESLTTVMVTHSMQQALEMGSRTIMMHKGSVIEDISAERKRYMTTDDLLLKFSDLRKAEQLTKEMLSDFKRQYC